MSDEKDIEYDYGSSLSFIGSLQTICGLLGGFAFTGITIVLALGDPRLLLSQVVLFILSTAMGMFLAALFDLNALNNLVCLHSQKPIIPIYPARWRRINIYMTLSGFSISMSVNLMFLLKNLIPLFTLSTSTSLIHFIWGYLKSWKPVEKELRRKGILS